MATIVQPGVVGSDRVKRVAFLTGMHEDTALGRLIKLWDNSQSLGLIEASETDLAFLLGAPDVETGVKWVKAYADPLAAYLKASGPSTYRICGNKDHIAKKEAIQERNRKINEKRWGKKSDPTPDATGSPDGSQEDPSTDPGGSRQDPLNEPSLNEPSLNQANHIPPTPPRPRGVNPVGYRRCVDEWLTTLAHFKAGRQNLHEQEELILMDAIRHWGLKPVLLAIIGARFEPKSPEPGGFNPRTVLALSRILPVRMKECDGRQQKFDRFLNLGVQAVNEGKAAIGDLGAA